MYFLRHCYIICYILWLSREIEHFVLEKYKHVILQIIYCYSFTISTFNQCLLVSSQVLITFISSFFVVKKFVVIYVDYPERSAREFYLSIWITFAIGSPLKSTKLTSNASTSNRRLFRRHFDIEIIAELIPFSWYHSP